IGGTIKHDLARAEIEKVLVDGFFPEVPRDAEPAKARTVGLQELGLPYVSDPGVTRHLAQFLHRQAESLANREPPQPAKKAPAGRAGGGRAGSREAPGPTAVLPSAVLFNGGVFKADPLRQRLLGVMTAWAKGAKADPVRELAGADLDLA